MATNGAVKIDPEHEASLEWQAILRKARGNWALVCETC